MWRTFALSAILATSSQLVPGETPAPFPLIGLWRATAATWPDGCDIKSRQGEMELRFLADSVVVETVQSPSQSEPVSTRNRYIFQSPDIITCSYKDGDKIVTYQERFRLDGDFLTFANLQSGIITKMRRVEQSEFPPPKVVRDAMP